MQLEQPPAQGRLCLGRAGSGVKAAEMTSGQRLPGGRHARDGHRITQRKGAAIARRRHIDPGHVLRAQKRQIGAQPRGVAAGS